MKQYFLFTLLLLQCFLGFAQAPNKMSYQAVIRNSNNTVVSNHVVGMRISILQGTATGSSVYTETQSPTTNANGLIAIEIGTGTIVSGSFANIDWANGPYFVKTETDPYGGSNYTLTGTSQLLSVPYALYAKKTDSSNVAKMALNALNGVPSGSQHGQTLTNCDGNLTWTYFGQCPAKISSFNCSDTIQTGVLSSNLSKANVNASITYNGGNGGFYDNQTFSSTGVIGLEAKLISGKLNLGSGSLTFQITGTPLSAGIAFFKIIIGDKFCIIQRTINSTQYGPNGTVYCNGTLTAVVNVTNPITGKTWMDRNLGASQAAISSTDAAAFGDLYQWGRGADGHQCRNSETTSTLSTTDQPGNSYFIANYNTNNLDWRNVKNNNLWQGINGVNNPCPSGYRIPTVTELENEISSWSLQDRSGALASVLKLPFTGYRSNGVVIGEAHNGSYWTNSVNIPPDDNPYYLVFTEGMVSINLSSRNVGNAVRCIKD